MNRFINPTKINKYNKTISDFSDLSRPMFSGVSRAYCNEKFTWVGDYLYKKAGNIVLNPNICYLDFVSNYDMVMQQYGCVPVMYNTYEFIAEKNRTALTDSAEPFPSSYSGAHPCVSLKFGSNSMPSRKIVSGASAPSLWMVVSSCGTSRSSTVPTGSSWQCPRGRSWITVCSATVRTTCGRGSATIAERR